MTEGATIVRERLKNVKIQSTIYNGEVIVTHDNRVMLWNECVDIIDTPRKTLALWQEYRLCGYHI